MMKASITILLLCHAVQIVLAFELYSSMDDARSAIMSFYDPIHVEPEKKAKETKSKNIPVKSISSSKKIMVADIAEPKFTLASSVDSKDIKILTHKRKFTWGGGKKSKFLPKFSLRPLGSRDSVVKTRFRKPVSIPKRRPSLSVAKPTSTRVMKKSKAKPVTSKRVSLNKFAEAIEDIEKALADAQIVRRVTHNEQRLRRLRDLIKTAVQKRSYRFARKAIGEAMYTIKKINEQR